MRSMATAAWYCCSTRSRAVRMKRVPQPLKSVTAVHAAAEAWDRDAVNGNGSVVLLQYTQPRGALPDSEKISHPWSLLLLYMQPRGAHAYQSSIHTANVMESASSMPTYYSVLLDVCPCDARPCSASKPIVLA